MRHFQNEEPTIILNDSERELINAQVMAYSSYQKRRKITRLMITFIVLLLIVSTLGVLYLYQNTTLHHYNRADSIARKDIAKTKQYSEKHDKAWSAVMLVPGVSVTLKNKHGKVITVLLGNSLPGSEEKINKITANEVTIGNTSIPLGGSA